MKHTDLPGLCSELASPIEDSDLLEMQKNEEQYFVGTSFVNGRVSGREKRGGERGRKFLEKKKRNGERTGLFELVSRDSISRWTSRGKSVNSDLIRT